MRCVLSWSKVAGIDGGERNDRSTTWWRIMNSAFSDWFEQQYGQRTPDMADKTDEQLRSIMQAGAKAGDVLHRRGLWDMQETVALYAWQAREKSWE